MLLADACSAARPFGQTTPWHFGLAHDPIRIERPKVGGAKSNLIFGMNVLVDAA